MIFSVPESFKGSDVNFVEKLLEAGATARAKKIDENMKLYIHEKKWWCPTWLYKAVIKHHVEVIIIPQGVQNKPSILYTDHVPIRDFWPPSSNSGPGF